MSAFRLRHRRVVSPGTRRQKRSLCNLDTGGRLGFKGLVGILNRIDADNIAQFYQSALEALVGVNGGAVFDDDLTLILLEQQVADQQFSARAVARLHKLIMGWMKRKDTSCTTALPELPHAANV